MHNKGFALLEMCICMFCVSIIVSLSLSFTIQMNQDYYEFADAYLQKQSQAILYAENRTYDNPAIQESISFNENGNVKHAQTLSFSLGETVRQIIIELGGGRLVFR